MDLLSSFNLHILPEQQTRINDAISQVLQSNPNLRLGFDSCCNCAKQLKNSDKEDVCCKVCKRVWYCSKECRRQDSERSNISSSGSTGSSILDRITGGGTGTEGAEEEDQARGHSAIVCTVLKLCNVDEEVENDRAKTAKMKSKNQSKTNFQYSIEEHKASMDRISSEYESYPATLNVIMDAPCFESTLDKFMLKRREKKTRQLDLDDDLNNQTLTIHIIGASEEAELWGDFQLEETNTDAMSAYADALSELVSTYRGMKKLVLAFVGPNCPKQDMRVVKNIHDMHRIDEDVSPGNNANSKKRKRNEGKNCQIVIETHCHNYEMKYFKSKDTSNANHQHQYKKKKKDSMLLTKPDVVIFFNPGFTCPDYQWHEALKVCQNHHTSSKTPFIVTTNTEMEAIADIQYLHQHGYIDSLPPSVADIVNEGQLDHDSETFEKSEHETIFFGENINAGTRVRQSGNMANDLFCKNKYLFGGHFSQRSEELTVQETTEPKVKRLSSSLLPPSKKKKGAVTNSKKTNAALM